MMQNEEIAKVLDEIGDMLSEAKTFFAFALITMPRVRSAISLPRLPSYPRSNSTRFPE